MSSVDKTTRRKEKSESKNGKPCIDFQPGDSWQVKEGEDSSDSQPTDNMKSNGRTLRSRSLRNSDKKDAPAADKKDQPTVEKKDQPAAKKDQPIVEKKDQPAAKKDQLTVEKKDQTPSKKDQQNVEKKNQLAVNGDGPESSGAHKDTSKMPTRTSSRRKAAPEEPPKPENGRASLKRKKSQEDTTADHKEEGLPKKAMKVNSDKEENKDNEVEVDKNVSNDKNSDSEIVEDKNSDSEIVEDKNSDSNIVEDKNSDESDIEEITDDQSSKKKPGSEVKGKKPPEETVVETISSDEEESEDESDDAEVVDLDSSIEMIDPENDAEKSLDSTSSISEVRDELSKDGSSDKTSEKGAGSKSKDDDIEIINVKDDDKSKDADDESDSEVQIINQEEIVDNDNKSDAQEFATAASYSEKDISLSAGYPYYNSLKEKISGFEAGDFKPVKFPHTGTLLLGENEVIIESPSLLVPLLIKEGDKFPKPEGAEAEEKEKKPEDTSILVKPPNLFSRKNFFQSSVGQFLINLGASRVQEWYHRDMKRAKQKQVKSSKATEEDLDKAVAFHEKRHEELKEINAVFTFRMRQCKFCSFKSESVSVMEGHYLTPHLSPRREYKCNFCTFLTRDPGTIVFHFEALHGKKAVLDANIPFHECVFCSFQSHLKTKVNVHMNRCRKHFIPSQNLAPPFDFEFPGVTTKPVTIADVIGHRRLLLSSKNQQRPTAEDNSAFARKKLASVLNRLSSQNTSNPALMKQLMTGQPQLSGSSIQLPPGIVITRPRGSGPIQQLRPINRYPVPRGNLPAAQKYLARPGRPPLNPGITASQLASSGISITPVTRPGIFQRPSTSISGVKNVTLTPIGSSAKPRAGQQLALYTNVAAGSSGLAQNRVPLNVRPLGPVAPYQRLNTPPSQVVKGTSGNTFVVCEICDSYIKDLEELRTHMNWVHKVKIHPKMLVSRPPLNCQKCQWRFFTDQGLERHLLGAHGLVTTNMQEMANKNQDGGRCIICGAVFTYKLVSHMTQVHKVTLKPAHLSYKCTVCTATFTLYRLFESHVYNVHSNSAKRNAEEPSPAEPPAKKPVIPTGPQKCRDCGVTTNDLNGHIVQHHMKDLKVKLCRIEKCKKCLYKSDEMILIRMSDFGLEDESSSGEDTSEEESSEEDGDKETG